ncbi:MAG TPA: hypothetical protein VFE78_31405, partial [Gemmataceae bacterium]|nr:hypothetical protein [Gemmataceae bacterium]
MRRLAAAPARFVRRRPWLALAGLALLGAGAALAGPHLAAWYHVRAGRAELARWHAGAARAHLDRALRVWPHSEAAHLLAARAAR